MIVNLGNNWACVWKDDVWFGDMDEFDEEKTLDEYIDLAVPLAEEKRENYLKIRTR